MTPHSLLAPARLAGKSVLRTQSDERLVDLVRAGNEAAFEAIVARYRRALLRYCSRLLGEERAEDVVQQTFVSAYDSMLGSRAHLQLRPWLYRIAHNTTLNALRDRGLRHEQLSEDLDGVERPDQALERSQGLRDTLAAVQALPGGQRDAIVLRELEGRSYQEIALALGLSAGAVRQLIYRARTTLRAGATAVMPAVLFTRVPWTAPGAPVAERVAELCAGAGAGAVAAKVCATALVTGVVVGGAVAPGGEGGRGPAAGTAPEAAAGAPRSDVAPAAGPLGASGEGVAGRGATMPRTGHGRGRRGGDGRGRRGRGRDDGRELASEREAGDGREGEREPTELRVDEDGFERDSDSSGPGSGPESDSPGFSGAGSSGSGSGSSGSGSSGSGSGSDGDSSSSGSGSSGSGSSGSGSSDSS